MNSEELKDRVKDDLGQMLEAHGIKADISEHHVEKLNASYEALSITPEGSRIGVNANLSAICDAIEDGQSYSEVVARAADSIIAGIENTPEINVEDLTNYDEMKTKLAMEVVVRQCQRLGVFLAGLSVGILSVEFRFQLVDK